MAWNGYSEKGQGSEERGPGTFTFAPPGVPQQQGSAPIMAKMGYQSAQSVGGLAEYSTGADKTVAALFGFAETMLKPVAQELAARKFLEGVQRAASGEALTEIVNEQPWYSRIFGPSTAVEAARQYSLDAQAAKFDAAVQKAMPSLRNTSPDELPAIIQKMSKEFETGDPTTDVQLGLRLTKVLPNLIQQHTREYYKAQQEHASRQQFDAMQQAATSLQAAMSGGSLVSEDDIKLRQTQLLQTLVTPPGVDNESQQLRIATLATTLAEQGQFHPLSTIINAGGLAGLSPEKRLQVEKQVDMLKRQHAAQAREDYAEQIDRLRFEAAYGREGRPLSGKEIEDDVRAINDAYFRLTGNDSPVLNASIKSSLKMTAAQAIMSANKELLTAGKAARTEEEKVQRAKAALQLGNTGAAIAAGADKSHVDQAFMEKFNEVVAGDPGMQKPETVRAVARLVSLDAIGTHTVKGIKDVFSQLMNNTSDHITANFEKASELLEAFKTAHPSARGLTNPAIAKYFEPKHLNMLVAYQGYMATVPLGLEPKQLEAHKALAFQRAFSTPSDDVKPFTGELDRLFTQRVDVAVVGNGWTGSKTSEAYAGNESGLVNKGWFGNDRLVPYAYELIRQSAQARYAALSGVADPKERMDLAIRGAMEDTEVYGKYAWPKNQGRATLFDKLATSPWAEGVAFSKVQLAQGLDELLQERVRSVTDETPDNLYIVPRGEKAGDQQFTVFASSGGQMYITEFSGTEVAVKAKQARARAPQKLRAASERGEVPRVAPSINLNPIGVLQ